MSPTPARGLYEKIITAALESDLKALEGSFSATRSNLRIPEAGDRLALHLAQLVQNAIETLADKERVARGLTLTRTLIETLAHELGAPALLEESPVPEESVLRTIMARNPDGSSETIESPLIPLLDTTLLTNAPGEPRVGKQLESEIDSASQIDLVMAFVRRSGIRPFLPVFGYKKLFKTDPAFALNKAELIVKNTCRTLMTRGLKGLLRLLHGSRDERVLQIIRRAGPALIGAAILQLQHG